MSKMTNEQKAKEIAKEYSRPYGFGLNSDSSIECYQSALKAMEWKDEQLIEQLTAFAVHLNKRGAFREDLCMDFEHEAQSFIELQYHKKL